MIRPKQCPTQDVFARLWMHESLRVFHDRLINNEDRRYYTEMLIEKLGLLGSFGWTHEDVFESEEPLMFCDFLKPRIDDQPGIYEMVKQVRGSVHTCHALPPCPTSVPYLRALPPCPTSVPLVAA